MGYSYFAARNEKRREVTGENPSRIREALRDKAAGAQGRES